MIIRNVITLTLNDLAIAFKNKTIYLILFIPFFVFISLKLVDREDADFKKINIGLIQKEMVAPVILQAIRSAGGVFTVFRISNEEEGKRWLKEKKIDGLLLRSEKERNSLVLVVLKKESLLTLSIVESFSALQKAVEGHSINWISDIKPLHEGRIQKQTLPTWILMLVLLVSFIIMPAQVAEEKEKKLLLALLQTPMREIEWLIAKLFLGMMLIFIAVLFLHLLGKFDLGNVLSYVAFIGVGSFCFSSYGIFLGFLCRDQASARTLGVIFYLPHLLPSALSDFSQKLTAVAPFLPSYQFYEPVKSILLEEGRISNLSLEWIYLLLVGLLTFFFSYLLMKKRWLM
ncbi:MAG: ABC transporter permease [Proteobacteria bacterium]|nr:ABC transporter permease [Desulfobacteraceae bacterium]MBU3981794.1 ABC transporter permease [Pseudomonadota bacterium]MBU4012400.1 ABC transporter permease [Pseudomonadota bacterium]MBU4068486.1 ABC transporter permease [Pseudomonadota bacterium]MBU4101540.1 ABC transporter permease [Pseudomonadota bacterium]